MTNEIDKSLGQLAFEAYRAEVVTAFNGDPIPEWDALDNGAPARRGWEAAAQAIARHTRLMVSIEKALEGPFVRRGRPSRWQPLEEPLPSQACEDGSLTARSATGAPVGDAEARAASASVPVVAEDDDSWDDGVELARPLPGEGADGEPEADQADGGRDEAQPE